MTISNTMAPLENDWLSSPLGNLCHSITDGTHYTPRYVTQGIPFYSVENVTANDFTNTKYITEDEHQSLIKRCKPEKGDILMTRIGSIGDTKLIDWDVNASIYVSLALLKLNNEIDPEYFYQYSKSNFFTNDVYKKALLNAIPMKINMDAISDVEIRFPRSKVEQKAIAKALSDIDELISYLKFLLEKKSLLFSGVVDKFLILDMHDVERVKLGKIAFIKTGSKNNNKSEDGKFKFFVRSDTVEKIDSYSYESEAILVPGEGRIGEIFHYVNEPHEVHQRVYRISEIHDNWNLKFVYWYMRRNFGSHALTNTVKATVDSLRLPTFEIFEIPKPKKEIQTEIARKLDEFEDELKNLQIEIIKYEQIKQGMMNDLLTGKVRLV